MPKSIGLKPTDARLSIILVSNNFAKITAAANRILVMRRFKQVDND